MKCFCYTLSRFTVREQGVLRSMAIAGCPVRGQGVLSVVHLSVVHLFRPFLKAMHSVKLHLNCEDLRGEVQHRY